MLGEKLEQRLDLVAAQLMRYVLAKGGIVSQVKQEDPKD